VCIRSRERMSGVPESADNGRKAGQAGRRAASACGIVRSMRIYDTDLESKGWQIKSAVQCRTATVTTSRDAIPDRSSGECCNGPTWTGSATRTGGPCAYQLLTSPGFWRALLPLELHSETRQPGVGVRHRG